MAPRAVGEPKYFCTASNCKKQIKSSFEAFLHPLLKCLVCRRCHAEYQTGDFSLFEDGVDEQGDDNFCRWCVDGGDLFACANSEGNDPDKKCHYSFCTECIRHNFPDDDVLKPEEHQGEDFKWKCYACDPSKLEKLRMVAQEAIIFLSQKDLKRANGTTTSDRSLPTKTSQDTEVTSTKMANPADGEEPGSAAKRRRTEASSGPETHRNSLTTQSSDNSKDRDRNKDKTVDKAKEKSNKEKDRDKEDNGKDRAPETINRPPLEPVRPVTSTLRSLKNPSSSIPKPPVSTPTPQQSSAFIVPDKNLTKSTPLSLSKNQTGPPPPANNDSKLEAPSMPNSTGTDSLKQKPLTSAMQLQHRVGLSKQLKSTNQPINPTTRVHLTEQDLKRRLEAFGKIKDSCVKEISTKFDSISEMFTTKELENKSILKSEIDDLKQSLADFQKMIISLDSLYSSQRV